MCDPPINQRVDCLIEFQLCVCTKPNIPTSELSLGRISTCTAPNCNHLSQLLARLPIAHNCVAEPLAITWVLTSVISLVVLPQLPSRQQTSLPEKSPEPAAAQLSEATTLKRETRERLAAPNRLQNQSRGLEIPRLHGPHPNLNTHRAHYGL